MYIPYVTSEEELVELVNAVGFLPFFVTLSPGSRSKNTSIRITGSTMKPMGRGSGKDR